MLYKSPECCQGLGPGGYRARWEDRLKRIVYSSSPNPTMDHEGDGSSRAAYIAGLACLFAFSLGTHGANYYLIAAAFVLLLYRQRDVGRIRIDFNLIMLIAFAGTYSLSAQNMRQVAVAFLFPVGYLVGLLVVWVGPGTNPRFRGLVLTLVAGMTLHGVLNAITNMQIYGLQPDGRALPDYWSGAVLTSTLQATFFVPLVGFSFYGLFLRQSHRLVVASLTSLSLAIAISYNFATASRSIFVAGAIVLSVCCLVFLWVQPRERLVFDLAVVLGSTLCVILYWRNSSTLQSMWDRSALTSRLADQETTSLGDDPRFDRWRYVVDNFWDYPFGGLNFRAQIGYIHNLWLDAYDTAGILSLLALLGFTFGSILICWRVVRLATVPPEIRVLVVGLWTALFAQFMTEPVLDGVPGLFTFLCVLSGGASGLGRLYSVRAGIPFGSVR